MCSAEMLLFVADEVNKKNMARRMNVSTMGATS